MKKFEKIKLFITEHKSDIQATALVCAYGIGAYILGIGIGRFYGQREGILNCNKLWMDFAEKCQKEEGA